MPRAQFSLTFVCGHAKLCVRHLEKQLNLSGAWVSQAERVADARHRPSIPDPDNAGEGKRRWKVEAHRQLFTLNIGHGILEAPVV